MNLEDILKIGTRAAQPAATSLPEGTLYSVNDEGYKVEQSRGGAWVTYAGSGGSSNSFTSGGGIPFPLPIDGDDGFDGFSGVPGIQGPTGATGSSGSGAGWTLVDSWNFSTNVAGISFIGLSANSELLLVFKDLILAADGAIYLSVSINNGSSYLNGGSDYYWLDTGGNRSNQAWFRPFLNPSTVARSGWITISPFNSADLKTIYSPMQPLSAIIPTLNALNAVQFGQDGSGFTGGSIRVYGR